MKKYQIFKPLLDRIYKFIHIYVCAGSLKSVVCVLKSGAAVVHLNFRAGSTFPVQVCTVPSSTDRTSRCNNWLTRSDFMLQIG